MKSTWRVDAVAIGSDGHPVPGLTTADFEILTDGKPRKVTAAEYHNAAPLRIALVVDDLSLSAENLALVKTALHAFTKDQMRPGDETAILSTSACDGKADQFSSETQMLDAAIERLQSNRPADDSALAFGAGSLAALRSAVLGLQFTAGRKLAVFLSERLRANDRAPDSTWIPRLLTAANRSSTVVYAVDVASTASATSLLEQGLAGLAPQTGGAFFDAAGDPLAALARIVNSQQGYYILKFETAPLDRTTPLTAKTARPDVEVRARNGVLGLAGDRDGTGFVAPDVELRAAIGTTLLGTGMHLELTPERGPWDDPYVGGMLHIETSEVTLTLEPDGRYHGELEALLALFQENDASVSQTSRAVSLHLSAEERAKALEAGFDLPLRLPWPKKGPYQLRAAVLDDAGGRVGAASRFIEVQDLPQVTLTIAPIQMEPGSDPARRSYPPGHPLQYSYEVANLRVDPQYHAKVQVTNQLLRDGKVIFAGQPQIIDVTLAPKATKARINGTVKLGAKIPAGKFTLSISAVDTLATGAARRSATQTIDFEVQP